MRMPKTNLHNLGPKLHNKRRKKNQEIGKEKNQEKKKKKTVIYKSKVQGCCFS